MDELDLLKKDWQKKEKDLPHLSYDEIYKMIWKRSSSMVKWIFYISIIEFIFWIALDAVLKISGFKPEVDLQNFEYLNIAILTAWYPVIFYFMYRFYINYRTISTTDSVKELMQSILKTRRAVKQYVWFNLIYIFVASCIVYIFMFKYDPKLVSHLENDSTTKLLGLIIGLLLVVLLMIGLIWLFYRLVYGILLKRLNKNYKELKQMEV